MRSARYHEYGGPEVLRVEDVPDPHPGPGQVLIRTEAVGASWVDAAIRSGRSPLGSVTLPASPHGDVVGTVEEVGDAVPATLLGTRVAGLAYTDAYAERAVAEARWLAPVPDGVDVAAASVLDMPAPTALLALRAGRVAPGETVLVHAAAGVIGHVATQLAKLEGAGTVIATAGSPEKLAFTREHGADVAVSYSDDDWAERVLQAAPGGVDVVLDCIGGGTTAASLGLLAPFGRLVLFGVAGGSMPELRAETLFDLRTVTAFGLVRFRERLPDRARAEMDELTRRVVDGELRVAVHTTVPLDDPAAAHRALEDRSRRGRVLLVP